MDWLSSLFYPFILPALPSQRIYIWYLFTALLIFYVVYTKRYHSRSITGFLRFCFPKDVYTHASTKLDLLYFFVGQIIFLLLVAPVMLKTVAVSEWVYLSLSDQFGDSPMRSSEVTAGMVVMYSIVVALAVDFGVFFAHYLFHHIPILWHFHKVHHSAEVLTPVTVYRMHPVDWLVSFSISALCGGLASGLFRYAFSPEIAVLSLFSISLWTALFYLFGYNLRHSHLWVSYPGWLHRLLISPAQHQIHHSIAPKHYDKNFGLIFSFWDRMFGCLYVPHEEEQITYGLLPKEGERHQHHTLRELLFSPFIEAYHTARGWSVSKKMLSVMALSLFGLMAHASFATTMQSVYLQDHSWTEVEAALKQGVTQIIIPTGGTEQNGPHMMLGKHNYIIHYAAGEVAKRYQHTLVAPVMHYVPEGDIEPKSGHMRYPGTLSIDQKTFMQLLIHTARSVKAHGFTRIYFMGDSGGNQGAQLSVAKYLSWLWQDEGVQVVALDEYYAANHQMEWLRQQGFSDEQIGTHAGIRDSSEMLFVHPEGIRTEWIQQDQRADPDATGVRGAPSYASAEIGKKMLELKIEAALKQMQRPHQIISPAWWERLLWWWHFGYW